MFCRANNTGGGSLFGRTAIGLFEPGDSLGGTVEQGRGDFAARYCTTQACDHSLLRVQISSDEQTVTAGQKSRAGRLFHRH